MDIHEIKCWAQSFRIALDRAFPPYNREKYPFNRFPNDCCDDVCDLFGQFLLERQISTTKIYGRYYPDNGEPSYAHVWLELNDSTIIDLTGDQYKNNPTMLNFDIPYYVGEANQLHTLFFQEPLGRRKYAGIDDYWDDGTRVRLWNLYNTVMEHMTEV